MQRQRKHPTATSAGRLQSFLTHAAVFLGGIFLANLFSAVRFESSNHRNNGSGHPLDNAELRSAKIQQEGSRSIGIEDRSGSELEQSKTVVTSRTGLATTAKGGEDGDEDGSSLPSDDGICSLLPRPAPSALSLWSAHLHRIVDATQHPADDEFVFRDFTAQLLSFVTPDRLERSVGTLPLDWGGVARALGVLGRRHRYISDTIRGGRPWRPDPKRPDGNAPRKLNVLVMGGSVTMGVVCHLNPVTTVTGKYARRSCAWPGRLASFLDKLFAEPTSEEDADGTGSRSAAAYDLVQVHQVTLGGTNTASGITVWDYSILPDDVPYPDVVINAYATNDMHYNSVQDALARNRTLAESVFRLGEEFVRNFLTPKDECRRPPVLLYFDDYLGNEQNGVLATLQSSQTIHLLAKYYGAASASYGDAVRDIVLGDTRESWFSANWYDNDRGPGYQRGVHPHMGMHIASVWVVAYNLFNLVTTYCGLPIVHDDGDGDGAAGPRQRMHAGRARPGHADNTWPYGYRAEGGLPPLAGSQKLGWGPGPKPRDSLPPPLTDDLSLEHVSELWREGAKAFPKSKADGQCLSAHHEKPCVHSWVAMLERRLDKPAHLVKKLAPFLTSNKGWGAADDGNKLGWVPETGTGAKFTMGFPNLARPVKAATFMVMKSYGSKWEGSKVKVEIRSKNEGVLKTEEITGYHDKQTSETYNIKLDLASRGGAKVGDDLEVIIELVEGTTFKILGMAICDH